MNNLFYNIKAAIINWFSDIRVYSGGIVLFGASAYQIKGPETRAILNIIKPGDLLLRRYSHYLGSILIKGYFSHAAIYVGDDRVIHMLGEGVTNEDILTFLRCDGIAILRTDEVTAIKAIVEAKDILVSGVPYDFNFHKDPDKMYCTEFIDYIYGNCIDYKRVIIPDSFLNCDIFTVVWKKTS